jgi:hypothetical protein
VKCVGPGHWTRQDPLRVLKSSLAKKLQLRFPPRCVIGVFKVFCTASNPRSMLLVGVGAFSRAKVPAPHSWYVTGPGPPTVCPTADAVARQKWPNETAFCAWLGLAPRHEISGGKVLRRSTLKTRNRAGQALRLAAQAAGRSQSGLGAFYRRMRARLGPQSAMVATAHQIARIVSHLLKHRTPCRDLSPEEYTQRIRAREVAAMRKKAARLGLTLVEGEA